MIFSKLTSVEKMLLFHELRLRCLLPMKVLKRLASDVHAATASHYSNQENMRAWIVPSFGNLDRLQLSDSIPVPFITHHKDVIVKVKAASVNPIDVAMVGGYGNTLLSTFRDCENYLYNYEQPKSPPLIPGRDFVGEVVAKGSGVRSDLGVGDRVYGMVQAHDQGCHADMVVAKDYMIRHVPEKVNPLEAAALLYCGLSAWSALCISGDLFWASKQGKKALVIGAAGGVGSLAVQLLKAWNMEVVATCRTDAVPLLEKLGVNTIIDYTAPEAMRSIENAGKYDIILDAAGNVTHYTYVPFLKDWANSKYVTLRSPLLANTDKYGLFAGMLKNATELVRSNIVSGAPTRGASIRWAYVLPIESGIDELDDLFRQNKIKPVIKETIPFKELPKAYEKVRGGHNRGKIVISMN